MSYQNSEQAYKQEFDAFMSIPKEDLVYCNMPLEVGTAEATQLGIVAAEDKEQLVNVGMDPKFADSLSSRAGAFSYAAAKYELIANSDPEALKSWEEFSPIGHKVHRYLIKFFTFAFRKDEALSNSVSKLKERRGDKDMILDLLSAYILGSENKELLSKIHSFDMSKIQEAQTLHNKLSSLYAHSNLDPKKANKAKDILRRAYTHYKQAAWEVIEHGRFAFEGTERYDSYVSAYRRIKRQQATSNKKTQQTS